MMTNSTCINAEEAQLFIAEISTHQRGFIMVALYSGLLSLFMALSYYLNRPHVVSVEPTDPALMRLLCKCLDKPYPFAETENDVKVIESIPKTDEGYDEFELWWVRGRVVLIVMGFSVVLLIFGCIGTANMFYIWFMIDPSEICGYYERIVWGNVAWGTIVCLWLGASILSL